jgi:hypothetical protein
MTDTLSTKAVAEHLDTEPRTLRRFLRDDPTYRNAGSGGRYAFTERDLGTLSKRFDKWLAGVDARRAKRDTTGLQNRPKASDVEPEVIMIPRCTPALRAKERDQIAWLQARLAECGLAVPQMREAENWVDVAS